MTQKKSHPSYIAEFRARGVQLFMDHRPEYTSENAAYKALASKLGCSPDRLRAWCQQSSRDRGERAGLSSEDKEKIKELEREVRELRQANEILKNASAYFTPALTHASMCCRAMGRSSTARSGNDLIY